MIITIIGLGLIGASYAMGLSKKGYTVYGVDKNPETIEYAKKMNFIKDGSTNEFNYISLADLVVVALYPNDVLPFIRKNLGYFKKGQVVTDVCGIKGSICEEATSLLSESYFIGSHPMAGREKVGILYANNEIFNNANFLICPVEGSKIKAIETLETVAKDLGFGNIYKISPKVHDEMIAYTSQLTHAIAVSLVNSNTSSQASNFIGDSYRDLTRIAMINENLWSQLFLENKDALISKIDEFVEELQIIKGAVESENLDLLKEKFISSKKKREVM